MEPAIDNSQLISAVQALKGAGTIKRESEISIALGYSKGVVSEYLNNKKAVSAGFLNKFSSHYGIRPPLIAADSDKASTRATPTIPEMSLSSGVPVFDYEFSAGFAASMKEIRETAHPIAYLSIPEVLGCDAIVRARGESMCDFINPMDWVGIKQITDFDVLLWGNAYGVVTPELEVFKYVRQSQRKGCVTLRSHNEEAYPDVELPVKKIEMLFLVKVVLPFSKVKILA